MLAGLLVLTTIVGVTPQAAAPMRYKVDIKSSSEMDLSAMGMGKQTGDLVASAWITVTMSDTAGGQIAHVLIDSMSGTPSGIISQQITPEAIAEAKGAMIHAYIVEGKVKGTPKPSVVGGGAQIVAQAMALLFPGTRATAKVGDVWADTAKTESTTEEGSQSGVTITAWKALSMDGDALVLEGTMTGTMSASQAAADVNISGKTAGTQKVTISGKGPARSVSATIQNDMTVVTPQAPDAIPVVATNTISVTAIP